MSKGLIERLRSNFPTTQAQFEAADRIEQLETEVERLKTTPAYKREDLHCVVSDLCEQVRKAEAERDELKIALNFARQGYQARFESGEAGDVEWAEMYIESIDAAIAKGEK